MQWIQIKCGHNFPHNVIAGHTKEDKLVPPCHHRFTYLLCKLHVDEKGM